MVEEILQDVAEAADQLQEDLEDHVFDNAVKDPNMVHVIFLIYL